jgi:hypothetical protein
MKPLLKENANGLGGDGSGRLSAIHTRLKPEKYRRENG